MANYASLKSAIQQVIKTNGKNKITGALLQQSLLSMINSLGVGYQFAGVATPSTNPGTPDQNVFYIASTAGTYANFGGLVLADGEISILKYNGAWSKDSTGAVSLEIVNQLGQYVDRFSLAGNGSTAVTHRIEGLYKNHTYQFEFDKTWSIPDVGNNVAIFAITGYISGVGYDIIKVLYKNRSSLRDFYEITLSSDYEYINVFVRAAAGSVVYCSIKDITAEYINGGLTRTLLNKDYFDTEAYFDASGGFRGISDGISLCGRGYLAVEPGTTLLIDNPASLQIGYVFLDYNRAFISSSWFAVGVKSITIPANCYYMRLMIRRSDSSSLTLLNIGDLHIILTRQEKTKTNQANIGHLIELGDITISGSGWRYKNSLTRVRTRNGLSLSLKKNDVFSCADSGLVYYIGWRIEGTYYTGGGWLSGDFVAPADAEYVFTARYSNEANITDIDRFLSAFSVYSLSLFDDYTNKAIGRAKSINPFKKGKNYGHLFINQITSETAFAVPCQSIIDVNITGRLGFPVMEGNVHKTATAGKYVVLHGVSGNLSKDIIDLNGDSAYGVPIGSTSFSDLRTNYTYRSKYAKNRIPISSLEEFLYACKDNNMTPLVTYVDDTELGIIRSICGDNFILYDNNGLSRSKYDGLIFSWNTDTSVANIINKAKSIGLPLMMGLGSTLSDANYLDVIAQLHDFGALVGIAGCYLPHNETIRLMRFGFDFNGSNRQVNEVRGTGVCLDNKTGTNWLSTSGASVDSEYTISIPAGSVIGINENVHKVGAVMKASLRMRYSGKLSVYMMGNGSTTAQPVTSDGSEFVEWSGFYVQGNTNNNLGTIPSVYIGAVDVATDIYEIEYKEDSV